VDVHDQTESVFTIHRNAQDGLISAQAASGMKAA